MDIRLYPHSLPLRDHAREEAVEEATQEAEPYSGDPADHVAQGDQQDPALQGERALCY